MDMKKPSHSPILLFLFFFLFSVSFAFHVRKNQANLSADEIDRFVSAVLTMKENGIYDQFVRLHSLTFNIVRSGPIVVSTLCRDYPESLSIPECLDWAHGGPMFLPWHRQFLLLFEQELQKIDSSVSLPYWDWTVDNSTNPVINHLWSDTFMGGNGDPDNHDAVATGPFASWPLKWFSVSDVLTRKFALNAKLPQIGQLPGLFSLDTYDDEPYRGNITADTTPTFRKSLEGNVPLPGWDVSLVGYMHNNVHAWVKGEMKTTTSPNDPLFFLHHCFIDYLWSKWMLQYPDSHYSPIANGPLGTNINDYLIPWDGIHNQPSYEFQYQYASIAPSNMTVKIFERTVKDMDLGYLYEGLLSYY